MENILLEFPKEGQELTFGQKAVGLKFNPSGSTEVDKAKLIAAAAIDQLHDLRNKAGQGQQGRHASTAITDYETAQMRAVKAITWQD